tara:strand:- start:239 stop:475 length:237 start_codon:yes stop_codon:yes gene_type:complete
MKDLKLEPDYEVGMMVRHLPCWEAFTVSDFDIGIIISIKPKNNSIGKEKYLYQVFYDNCTGWYEVEDLQRDSSRGTDG